MSSVSEVWKYLLHLHVPPAIAAYGGLGFGARLVTSTGSVACFSLYRAGTRASLGLKGKVLPRTGSVRMGSLIVAAVGFTKEAVGVNRWMDMNSYGVCVMDNWAGGKMESFKQQRLDATKFPRGPGPGSRSREVAS